ncbi:MAG: hypothetical protein J7L61_00665 [Thermoplasmata archaeon]|nr:hypothetical protein [Thermoplasmata archaeon]
MKARSGHIRFPKKTRYRDLAEIFPKLFYTFLEETGQVHPDEPEVDRMLLSLNMADLKENRKPEGYNRPGSIRMIFPLSGRVEFYIAADAKVTEVVHTTQRLSQILEEAGLHHTVEWDQMYLDELKRRKQQGG